MLYGKNKKGLESSTLVEMLLIIGATVVLLNVFTAATTYAGEKTSESLCKNFNTIRFGTKVETPVGNYNLVPRACKTIDKSDLPTKDYKDHIDGPKEGAKAEIRDLMSKCWGMWIEGKQPNMFESQWYNLQNGCFVCYTFGIDKNTGSFSYDEYTASLYNPYYAVDSSDKCAGSLGGFCREGCIKSSEREAGSYKCKQGEKCCISADNNKCENKGGKCLPESKGEYIIKYINDDWRCESGGACFVKADNMMSYLDYIHGGVNPPAAPSRIRFGDKDDFNPNNKYAIAFVSPGKSWDLSTLLGLTVTGGGLYVVVGVAAASGIFTIPTLVAVTAATATGLITSSSGTVNDINFILISKYDTVKDKCAIEAGVGQK